MLFRRYFSDLAGLQRRLRQSYSLGDYSAAQRLAEQLVTETLEQYGDTHPAHLSALSDHALVYKTVGDYEKAVEMYRKAYEGYREGLGAGHRSAVTVLHNWGLT